MPRIAHVLSTPFGLGGAEHLVARLAAYSASCGDDVCVINTFEQPQMGEALTRACAGVPVVSHQLRRTTELPAMRRWLAAQLERHQPDVVHVHLARAMTLVASLPRVPGRRLLLSHHHGDLFLVQGRAGAQRAERLARRRYDHVVAVSQSVADTLVSSLGYPPSQVSVILNGWVGQPAMRDVAVPPRVVCVGRLRPEKGQAVLVEAFRTVLDEVPDAELHLLGDGPERPELMRRAATIGLGSALVLHGDVRDVWPHLAHAAVVVQPSLAEPFGIATLEAMAAGAPVVASSTGGLPELVSHDRTGLLVPPGDADALAAAVLALLRDPDRAGALAARARERASELRLERTLERYGALYRAMADHPPRKG